MSRPVVHQRSSLIAGVFRLLLGGGFVAAAAWWVLSTESVKKALYSYEGRHLTRVDLPALPLLAAGGALVLLAIVGRRRGPARVATVMLALAGPIGAAAAWWLADTPVPEGQVLAVLSSTHGVTESDVLVVPLLVVGGICGLAGVVELVRSTGPVDSQR